MKIEEQVLLNLNTDKSFTITLHTIGRYLLKMNIRHEVIRYLKQATKIKEQVSLNLNINKSLQQHCTV